MNKLTLAFFLFTLSIPISILGQSKTIASDFEMSLLNGNMSNLSDYKGKVIYISFWATWCKPCIQNFKKYKTIRTRLEKEGVVLLNVSIDKNESSWKEYLNRNTINGVNALASKEELYPDYELSSIPLYEIVSKGGQFLYLSDEGNRDIVGQFKNWVKE